MMTDWWREALNICGLDRYIEGDPSPREEYDGDLCPCCDEELFKIMGSREKCEIPCSCHREAR